MLHWITRLIEAGGIAIIVVGAVVTTARFVIEELRRENPDGRFYRYRSGLGRAILLGLEFLVAADIIGTVAITPTLESVAVLGIIVIIRTFLSFSLSVEIEGRLPWQRATAEDRPGTAEHLSPS